PRSKQGKYEKQNGSWSIGEPKTGPSSSRFFRGAEQEVDFGLADRTTLHLVGAPLCDVTNDQLLITSDVSLKMLLS
ncbi:MAG: hypothetical protein AAGG72_04875, partial [Pseudomonadota bacterium]